MLLNIDKPHNSATLHSDDRKRIPKPVGTRLKPVDRLGDDAGLVPCHFRGWGARSPLVGLQFRKGRGAVWHQLQHSDAVSEFKANFGVVDIVRTSIRLRARSSRSLRERFLAQTLDALSHLPGAGERYPYMASECFWGTYLLSGDVFSAGASSTGCSQGCTPGSTSWVRPTCALGVYTALACTGPLSSLPQAPQNFA